jgi:hypothetical protein
MLDMPGFEWDRFGTFRCTVATARLAGKRTRNGGARLNSSQHQLATKMASRILNEIE